MIHLGYLNTALDHLIGKIHHSTPSPRGLGVTSKKATPIKILRKHVARKLNIGVISTTE